MRRSFAAAFDLKLKPSNLASTRVSGTFKANTASAFLDQLSEQYRFAWFVHASTLYSSDASFMETVRFQVGPGGGDAARNLLSTHRLLELKFGWLELPDDAGVEVSGPPDYLRLVRAALKPLTDSAAKRADASVPTAVGQPEIMVFRLRNANAEDRSVTFRGQVLSIPRLATILRTVLNSPRDTLSRAAGASALPPEMIDSAVSQLRAAQLGAQVAAGRSVRPLGNGGPDAAEGVRPAWQGMINIEADPRINAILVVHQASRRPYCERLIRELDIEQRLVEIEALIIDIDRQLLNELGVEWTAGGARAGFSGTLEAVAGIASTTFVIPNVDIFFARLRALDTSGKAAILAKPSVLTLDDQAAVLDLSKTDYIRLVGERVVDLREVTAVTLLRMVPRVLEAGGASTVQLLIDIEDGTLEPGPRRGDTPIVQRSTISTQAVIDVGQSLVVGGYRSSQQRSETSKIPVLGDIPLVGGLFRSTRTQDRNMERLFILTPRLVGPGSAARFNASPASPMQGTARSAERRLGVMRPVDPLPVTVPVTLPVPVPVPVPGQ